MTEESENPVPPSSSQSISILCTQALGREEGKKAVTKPPLNDTFAKWSWWFACTKALPAPPEVHKQLFSMQSTSAGCPHLYPGWCKGRERWKIQICHWRGQAEVPFEVSLQLLISIYSIYFYTFKCIKREATGSQSLSPTPNLYFRLSQVC